MYVNDYRNLSISFKTKNLMVLFLDSLRVNLETKYIQFLSEI